jgi:hypothetical protein
MRRHLYLLLALLAFTGIGCPPAPPPPEKIKKDEAKVENTFPAPIEEPANLKGRIEGAISHVQNRDLLTTHAFWTVFHGILGTGLENTMLKDEFTGKKVNAIDYICKGGKIRGLQFLPTADGLDVQIGPQFEGQGHQDQFIAEMTQWGMPRERKFLIGARDFTFEDFIHHSRARASVTKKQELSWAIIIIAQFYGTDATWTNSDGEKLRFEDVVRYELDQPIDAAACGGTHRLFGLTWAYYLHLKRGGKKEGVWNDVAAKLQSYKDRAHELQNPDGSFSTDYFKSADKKRDPQVQIGTTGHTVEWLALAMTDAELRAPWMQDAVSALTEMIIKMGDQSIESGALYHATHGLHIYYDRVFGTPAPYLPLPPKK